MNLLQRFFGTGDSTRYTIELYLDAKSEWRWRVRHANGQVIGQQGYSSKLEALTTATNFANEAKRIPIKVIE
jgi:uncharacterized protein YegP (UPF0339 family)